MRTAPITVLAPADALVVVTVKRAQDALNRLGAKLTADGLFGPKTQAAWQAAAKNRSTPTTFDKVSSTQARVSRRAADAIDHDAPPASAATPEKAGQGYDRQKAKNAAKDIAAHLTNQGRAYDKKRLSTWQTQAGILADGLYGPKTKAALEYFGAKPPSPPFVAGPPATYVPPT